MRTLRPIYWSFALCALLGTTVLAAGRCPNGHPTEDAWKFCAACGAKLLKEPIAAVTAPVTAATGPGVVCHVKVLSDKSPDVSSIEAWKKSFLKDGMTDEQKALAVWESVVGYRHQDPPPKEWRQGDQCVHDPIKTFNVYGYGMCCCAASNVEGLARAAGLQAQAWSINKHNVPEIFYDGEWHMFDASLINYFRRTDGKLASVAEIIADVKGFLAEHADLKGDTKKLYDFMRADGWTGWRKGPALLASNPFYGGDGWLPAKTHGWAASMEEYDGSVLFLYECPHSMGYQVNIRLRPGERLVRNWLNKGLHVNMDGGEAPGAMKGKVGEGDMAYQRKYGDLNAGRVGSGTYEYDVPLANGAFRTGALTTDNVACTAEDKQTPAVHVKDGSKPGLLEIEMPSSYVYLNGTLTFKAVVGKDGQVTALCSDNNGLDWKELARVTESGDQSVDLKPLVVRRYDYRLRFVLKGAGTGLDALEMSHGIQCSQRALPTLTQGKNTLTFSAGPDEGTVTIDCTSNPDYKSKQVTISDFHPELSGVEEKFLRVGDSGKGEVTIPIETPGDMVRLRFGGHYRARDQKDGWDVLVSFDDGKTFNPVDRFAGPTPNMCKFLTVSDVPAGRRKALVRFSGQQRNTTCLFSLSLNADYKLPNAGFRPVRVTYVWEEGGIEKQDAHVAKQPNETYEINCDGAPVMRSVILELAG